MQGFLVLFEATDEKDTVIKIEAWFSKKRKYVEYAHEGLAGRLNYLEVSPIFALWLGLKTGSVGKKKITDSIVLLVDLKVANLGR